MESIEYKVHSFIIKVWIEEKGDDTGDISWRGRITHVPSNHSRYIDYLEDITLFIAHYLKQIGVDIHSE